MLGPITSVVFGSDSINFFAFAFPFVLSPFQRLWSLHWSVSFTLLPWEEKQIYFLDLEFKIKLNDDFLLLLIRIYKW